VCPVCADYIDPKPIFQVDSAARILIAGQAPGAHAHRSGVPFDDASGDRLRGWMGIDKPTFFDSGLIAILPSPSAIQAAGLRETFRHAASALPSGATSFSRA